MWASRPILYGLAFAGLVLLAAGAVGVTWAANAAICTGAAVLAWVLLLDISR